MKTLKEKTMLKKGYYKSNSIMIDYYKVESGEKGIILKCNNIKLPAGISLDGNRDSFNSAKVVGYGYAPSTRSMLNEKLAVHYEISEIAKEYYPDIDICKKSISDFLEMMVIDEFRLGRLCGARDYTKWNSDFFPNFVKTQSLGFNISDPSVSDIKKRIAFFESYSNIWYAAVTRGTKVFSVLCKNKEDTLENNKPKKNKTIEL
jgi:hypothetical protein